MKKAAKKLGVDRECLKNLSVGELGHVRGGDLVAAKPQTSSLLCALSYACDGDVIAPRKL